ncbi:unnamed protein product [Ixodes pacificus]
MQTKIFGNDRDKNLRISVSLLWTIFGGNECVHITETSLHGCHSNFPTTDTTPKWAELQQSVSVPPYFAISEAPQHVFCLTTNESIPVKPTHDLPLPRKSLLCLVAWFTMRMPIQPQNGPRRKLSNQIRGNPRYPQLPKLPMPSSPPSKVSR